MCRCEGRLSTLISSDVLLMSKNIVASAMYPHKIHLLVRYPFGTTLSRWWFARTSEKEFFRGLKDSTLMPHFKL